MSTYRNSEKKIMPSGFYKRIVGINCGLPAQGFQKGNKLGTFNKGQISHNKGKPMSKEQKEKLHQIWDKRKVKIKCINCGLEFLISPSKKTAKYCSRECFNSCPIHRKIVSEKLKGRKKAWNGHSFPKGHIPWNKNKKGTVKSPYKGKTIPWLVKYQFKSGKLHRNWKNAKSRSTHGGKRYKEWRTEVFTQDNFTCQFCKINGGYLEAHHIESWSKYPKLRYKLNNGITLCKKCHKLANKIQRQIENAKPEKDCNKLCNHQKKLEII